MTTTMNISLPKKMKDFVDERVKDRGYGSHSEYMRDLVRRDEREAAIENLRALIEEGLASEPEGTWEELRAELQSRLDKA